MQKETDALNGLPITYYVVRRVEEKWIQATQHRLGIF